MSFRFPVRELVYQSDDSTSSAVPSDIATFAIPAGFLRAKDILELSMEIRSMVNSTTSLSIQNTSVGTDIIVLPGIGGGFVANEAYTFTAKIYCDVDDAGNKTFMSEGLQQDTGSSILHTAEGLVFFAAAITAGFTIGVHQGGVGAGGTLKIRITVEVIRGQ